MKAGAALAEPEYGVHNLPSPVLLVVGGVKGDFNPLGPSFIV